MKVKPPDKSKIASSSAEITAHLAKFPKAQGAALGKLRKLIKEIVPAAVEGFSYGMPAFKYLGHPLVAYDAFKEHCSFFPMSPAIQASFTKELKPYNTSKGTIQFLPEKPLPASLVKNIVKARVMELEERYG